MAFVVAVASRKGGVGKSTLTANLATALAAGGARVSLVDGDPQGTLAHWHRLRPEGVPRIGFESATGWRLEAAAKKAGREADFVILDTPPHAEADARAAIRASRLVLIPLQPSLPDLWAIDATLSLAAAERKPVALVLSRVPPQGKLRDEVAAAIAERDLPLLPARLGNRSGFAVSFARGLGAVEDEPRGKAAAEAQALAEIVRAEAG